MEDSDIRKALDDIRSMLADLAARVAAFEATASADAASPVARPAPAPAAAAAPPEPAITEEIVIAIGAAVAAFLGERAHVRQIRLISSPAWAQQGRVFVQASHRLDR